MNMFSVRYMKNKDNQSWCGIQRTKKQNAHFIHKEIIYTMNHYLKNLILYQLEFLTTAVLEEHDYNN